MLAFAALMLIAGTGCKKKKPTACIDAPKWVEVDQGFTFNSCSEDADSYEWNFGDGSNATTQNPGHTYDEIGTYTVTHLVHNDEGSDEASQTVKVIYCPLENFNTNVSIYRDAPGSSLFHFEHNTVLDEEGIVYQWELPSGPVDGATATYDYGSSTSMDFVILRQNKGTCAHTSEFTVYPDRATGVKVNSATVTAADFDNSGFPWDINPQDVGGPDADAYLQLSGGWYPPLESATQIDVTEANLPMTFDFSGSPVFYFYKDGSNSTWLDVTMYDDDGSSQAFTSYVDGLTSGYFLDDHLVTQPSTITITANSFTVTLNVTWY